MSYEAAFVSDFGALHSIGAAFAFSLRASPHEVLPSPPVLSRMPHDLAGDTADLLTKRMLLPRSPSEMERSPSTLELSPSKLELSPSELERSPSELDRSERVSLPLAPNTCSLSQNDADNAEDAVPCTSGYSVFCVICVILRQRARVWGKRERNALGTVQL